MCLRLLGASPPDPHQGSAPGPGGLCPWTPLRDFHPQTSSFASPSKFLPTPLVVCVFYGVTPIDVCGYPH